MNQDRLRWITRPPTLDRWEMGVRYSKTPTGMVGVLTVMGYCDRKRGALWSYSETHACSGTDYGLSDAILHLALVLEQDLPATEAALQASLIGQNWVQPELPF